MERRFKTAASFVFSSYFASCLLQILQLLMFYINYNNLITLKPTFTGKWSVIRFLLHRRPCFQPQADVSSAWAIYPDECLFVSPLWTDVRLQRRTFVSVSVTDVGCWVEFYPTALRSGIPSLLSLSEVFVFRYLESTLKTFPNKSCFSFFMTFLNIIFSLSC